MSSFDRRSLILMPLALAGCGFAPVYGPGGAGKRLYGAVTIVTPATEESYLLYRELEERLGHATAPDYRLALTPSITAQGQAVTAAGLGCMAALEAEKFLAEQGAVATAAAE